MMGLYRSFLVLGLVLRIGICLASSSDDNDDSAAAAAAACYDTQTPDGNEACELARVRALMKLADDNRDPSELLDDHQQLRTFLQHLIISTLHPFDADDQRGLSNSLTGLSKDAITDLAVTVMIGTQIENFAKMFKLRNSELSLSENDLSEAELSRNAVGRSEFLSTSIGSMVKALRRFNTGTFSLLTLLHIARNPSTSDFFNLQPASAIKATEHFQNLFGRSYHPNGRLNFLEELSSCKLDRYEHTITCSDPTEYIIAGALSRAGRWNSGYNVCLLNHSQVGSLEQTIWDLGPSVAVYMLSIQFGSAFCDAIATTGCRLVANVNVWLKKRSHQLAQAQDKASQEKFVDKMNEYLNFLNEPTTNQQGEGGAASEETTTYSYPQKLLHELKTQFDQLVARQQGCSLIPSEIMTRYQTALNYLEHMLDQNNET